MKNVRLTLDNGKEVTMQVAGTFQEITSYFLYAIYNNQKVINVEFITAIEYITTWFKGN